MMELHSVRQIDGTKTNQTRSWRDRSLRHDNRTWGAGQLLRQHEKMFEHGVFLITLSGIPETTKTGKNPVNFT